MAFADPPDNIGLGYDGYDDKIPDFEYEIFLQNIIKYSTDKCDVLWLSLNSRHTFMAGHVIHKMLGWLRGEWEAKSCVQTFTFGQHNHRDLGNNHRLLYRLMKTGTEIYPDAIRVPSWRQLNGDKRETVSNVERFRQLSFTKDCMYDVSSSAALLAMTLSLICSPVVAHLEELRQLAEWTLSWLNSPRPSASK
jgi:hypothetical protein